MRLLTQQIAFQMAGAGRAILGAPQHCAGANKQALHIFADN
jgi:hypothetical protein